GSDCQRARSGPCVAPLGISLVRGKQPAECRSLGPATCRTLERSVSLPTIRLHYFPDGCLRQARLASAKLSPGGARQASTTEARGIQETCERSACRSSRVRPSLCGQPESGEKLRRVPRLTRRSPYSSCCRGFLETKRFSHGAPSSRSKPKELVLPSLRYFPD